MAGAIRLHERHYRVGTEESAFEVGVHHSVVFRFARSARWCSADDTGRVHEDMHVPKGSDDGLHHGLDLGNL